MQRILEPQFLTRQELRFFGELQPPSYSAGMKYGERLKLARDHAGLSQSDLALRAGVGTQENVSKLERGDATGSEFSVHYAVACGVRPEWLAMEDGEMTVASEPQRAAGIAIMQKLPTYALASAVKTLTAFAELPAPEHPPAQAKPSPDHNGSPQSPPRRKRAVGR